MARCMVCGATLQDASQRLCGGDTCQRVLMKDGPGRLGVVAARVTPTPGRWPRDPIGYAAELHAEAER